MDDINIFPRYRVGDFVRCMHVYYNYHYYYGWHDDEDEVGDAFEDLCEDEQEAGSLEGDEDECEENE